MLSQLISGSVNLEYLRKVDRFNSSVKTDYYFICEVEGQVLQWGVGTWAIVGYRKDEVGKTFVNAQMDFNITSTLLLARPLEDGGTFLVSVLVISMTGDYLSLSVSCTNNVVLSNVSTDCDPKYRQTNDDFYVFTNIAIAFDYILSTPFLQLNNCSLLLHIFMCKTESLTQQVGRDDSRYSFSSNSEVGETRKELSADNTKVNIEAILISRELLEITSLLFIIDNTNFTAKCSFESMETSATEFSLSSWTSRKCNITTISRRSLTKINSKLNNSNEK